MQTMKQKTGVRAVRIALRQRAERATFKRERMAYPPADCAYDIVAETFALVNGRRVHATQPEPSSINRPAAHQSARNIAPLNSVQAKLEQIACQKQTVDAAINEATLQDSR
jgi:hypothetical protein